MTSPTATGRTDLAVIVHGMNRRALLHQLTHFDPGFKLDFTEEFLASRSNEQLRHILLAAHLQARSRQRRSKKPAPVQMQRRRLGQQTQHQNPVPLCRSC